MKTPQMFIRSLKIVTLTLVWPMAIHAQNANDRDNVREFSTSSVQESLDKLRSGAYSLANLETLARSTNSLPVPLLTAEYDKQSDELTKAKLASTLIRLGKGDEAYWQFLGKSLDNALLDTPPSPFLFDHRGHTIPGTSAAFERWALDRHMSTQEAGERYFFDVPALVLFIAQTERQRAVPYLMRALSSSNPYVEINASLGLAQMKVNAAIPKIIAACDSAPLELQSTLAESLIYFDDPLADKAARRLIPNEERIQLEKGKSQGLKALR